MRTVFDLTRSKPLSLNIFYDILCPRFVYGLRQASCILGSNFHQGAEVCASCKARANGIDQRRIVPVEEDARYDCLVSERAGDSGVSVKAMSALAGFARAGSGCRGIIL